MRSVPICAEVRNGLDAVKATRKALGKAAVGKPWSASRPICSTLIHPCRKRKLWALEDHF